MGTVEKLNDKATKLAFNRKVVSISQHLQAYVKHRLYVAESTGVIPKNMYVSNDFIDEAIAKYYESGFDIDIQKNALKLKLFQYVDSDLVDLFKKEAFHKSTVSTSFILNEELAGLEERLTVDEDFEIIMAEDLNDISYKQDNKHRHLFIYDDKAASVVGAFKINRSTALKDKNLLGKFYSWLPLQVSDIVDLYVFGRLTTEEISQVKNIEPKRVELVFELVSEAFKEI